jgi:hypothetical protein
MPKTGLQLEELQIVFPPLEPPYDDDDDERERESLSTLSLEEKEGYGGKKPSLSLSQSALADELKSLRFSGAAAFVAKHDPQLISEALDEVAPRSRITGRRFIARDRQIRSPAALIRWLVAQAEQQADS